MIHFDAYGDKNNQVLLLLHGAAATDTFCQQYYLANKYYVVVPHLYGAGESIEMTYEPHQMKSALWELIDTLGKEPLIVMGHSLGAQLAIMLVCERPTLFSKAIFLSAWINPTPQSIGNYCKMARWTAKMLHWGWLVHFQAQYWHYTKEQANYMVAYSKQLTGAQYEAFFKHTLHLKNYPEYSSLMLPMLAICGEREVEAMKESLRLLGANKQCRALTLKGAGHDFPMRKAKVLNPFIEDFLRD